MVRSSWNAVWRTLAAFGLCAVSLPTWGQAIPPLPAPPLAPPVAGQPDVLFWASPAPVPLLAGQDLFAFAAPQDVRWQIGTDGPASDERTFFFTQGAAAPPPVTARYRVVKEETGGDYWIGVQLEPLPEIITSQLKLNRGMVVVHVFDGSPAAKAEVKVNDIVLRAGDKDIKEPQDLISAVNEAKEKELVIVSLRGGTETMLKITPAKRPNENIELAVSPDTPHAAVVEALEELHKRAPDGDVRLFAVRPGGVYAWTHAAKFPSNLEITIEKRGDKPATIRVKRIQEGEDKTWEVTEDKIGELPEDIRGHVQQLLGRQGQEWQQALGLRLDSARAQAQEQAAKAQEKVQEAQKHLNQTLREYRIRVQPPMAAVPATPAVPGAPAAAPVPFTARLPHIAVSPQADGSVQAKLDAILSKLDQQQGDALQRLQKEVERLRKEVEDLRQGKK